MITRSIAEDYREVFWSGEALWTILRVAAIIFLASIISTVLTIRQMFKIEKWMATSRS